MIINANKATKEDFDYLVKFLIGDKTLDPNHRFVKESKYFYGCCKDTIRTNLLEKPNLTDSQQYGQFKLAFNNSINWVYEHQEDLDKLLDWFLEVYSNTNKEDFYKLLEKECENKYSVNLHKFIDEQICQMDKMEFENREDIMPYKQALDLIVEQLDTILYRENTIRIIYNRIKDSLKNNKNESKSYKR